MVIKSATPTNQPVLPCPCPQKNPSDFFSLITTEISPPLSNNETLLILYLFDLYAKGNMQNLPAPPAKEVSAKACISSPFAKIEILLIELKTGGKI